MGVATSDSLVVSVSGRCALHINGTVHCHDMATGRFVELAGAGPFQAVWTGPGHACALDASGAAWCWGDNFDGRLGDGTTERRTQATRVAGEEVFVQLALGSSHSCGRTATGDVWCWGGNVAGQSGTSILNRPLVPVRVRGQ
jgi:alpha-tubulin suppressor-like RCC1 family protein